jgi:predicted N-acetyltransferase YhbS
MVEERSPSPGASPRVTICHLHEHPEHLGTVARWIHDEWWTERPGHTVETMEARLGEAADPDRIPLSLVALREGVPIGTVNLVDNDNEERPQLTPWLAALLVEPRHRGCGVGARLVGALAAEAARLGIARLYLGTDIPRFYERLGARIHETFADAYCIMSLETGFRPGGAAAPVGG